MRCIGQLFFTPNPFVVVVHLKNKLKRLGGGGGGGMSICTLGGGRGGGNLHTGFAELTMMT